MSGDDVPTVSHPSSAFANTTPQTGEVLSGDAPTIEVVGADVSEDGQPTQDVGSILRMVAAAAESRHEHKGHLAAGGMGAIDLVVDRTLNRRTVMKRIHPHLGEDTRSVRMFVREAQVTGQLEHPNIVPVHELGVDQHGALYFTMKLVEGRTFLEILRDLPPGPLDHDRLLDLLDVVVKVCDALAFAHSRRVVHCDIKPANVMVGDFGQVYLMDWGVARILKKGERGSAAANAQSTRLELTPSGIHPDVARTEHGYLVGTPTHMSPEQALARNDELDERSDVYAVGALVYHVLTRRAPHEAETFWAAVALAQQGRVPSIESIAGEGAVPRALVRIVERAMAADPADRYSSISELRTELLRFVRGGDAFPAISFPAGALVVREGEPGDAAYIIQSGRLEAYQGEGESRRVLRQMGPGEVFGEMAILSPGPRTANVVTLEPTTLHVVNGEVLERELEAMKPWLGAFVRTLAARFREREDRGRR